MKLSEFLYRRSVKILISSQEYFVKHVKKRV